MRKILIVDDEKIERNGIKFLLKSWGQELEIFEANNGKEACRILKEQQMDILFTDIKMPFMNGIELVEQARQLQPEIEMAIFSGYGEFEYAQKAMRFGVKDYVLKPVDPEEFHQTFEKIIQKIDDKARQKIDQESNREDLSEYFLSKYLYQGTPELFEKISRRIDTGKWKAYRGMFLLESDDNFFEEKEAQAAERLCGQLQQELDFLNLSQERELCLVKQPCDLNVCAEHISEVLNRFYGEKFYVAASGKISSPQELPEAFRELDMRMENKFYRKSKRVFLAEEPDQNISAEQYMSDVMNHMVEDLHLNDMIHLWEHFHSLRKSAEGFRKYSQIYTKFLFANLVKEFYTQLHKEGSQLEQAIQKIYELQSMDEVLASVEALIEQLEQQLGEKKKNARDEIAQAKSYIYAHYQEELSVEILAELVYLSPGYFSYMFKKETGQNLSRFVKEYRIEQAKKRLAKTNMKIVQICQETGFSNVSYFCKSFREYCGCSPEQFRKGDLKVE